MCIRDRLHPVNKTLFVVRASAGYLILSVMFISNVLTLHAARITPRLRVKAYALTTSMTASNVLLSIWLIDWLVYPTVGVQPCNLEWFKAAVRPVRRWILYVAYIHVSVIAVDRYMAVMKPLHYENRVTPTVIRNLIVAIWVAAGALSLPGYLGYVWPDPASCIATQWPKYETAVEVSTYAVSCTLVIVVYIRIWNEVMHSELVQQQQQQPNWAAATTSGNTSQSDRRTNVEHGVRMLWHHKQLIRKHRATRTTMVTLVNCTMVTQVSYPHHHGHSGQLPTPPWSYWSTSRTTMVALVNYPHHHGHTGQLPINHS